MSPAHSAPATTRSEHDGDGRLVRLVFDSTPPFDVSNAQPWLLAVDHSDNALRAVAHAADLASRLGACSLHLIHVQPWLSREAAEAELAHRALETTARARELLDARGLSWRLHTEMGDPAERILDCAARLQATSIVIGSRGFNAVESLLIGSVTYKVMHLAKLPVTVVP